MKEILKYFNKSLDEIMESLEYLAKDTPDLKLEAVIQTTAGEIYTSDKILFRQDLQD